MFVNGMKTEPFNVSEYEVKCFLLSFVGAWFKVDRSKLQKFDLIF